MSAALGVKVTDGEDRAPAVDYVEMVGVSVRARLRPKIEVCASQNGAVEVATKARIILEDCCQNDVVVCMKFRLEVLKSTCSMNGVLDLLMG